MANIELGAIIDAIETTVSAATGITSSQSYDELKENIPEADTPLLQVWARQCRVDPTGETDRYTMGQGYGPHRHKYILVNIDLFSKARSASLAEEMKKNVDSIDAIMDVLETQDTAPFFGLATDQLKSFNWRWDYEAWEFSGKTYVGARFELELTVY